MAKQLRNPRDYGIDHDEWRPGQESVLPDLLEMAEQASKKPLDLLAPIVLEAPTGTGKSAIATAIGSVMPVTVLMGTLSLLDQYHDKYGFEVLKGKQEYPCVNTEYHTAWKKQGLYDIPTAADCPFARMVECPYAGECTYLHAKTIGRSARRLAVTYAYATRSRLFQERPGALVMDEAHESVEWLLAANEERITESLVSDLTSWPPPIDLGFDGYVQGDQLDRLKTWVFAAADSAHKIASEMNQTDPEALTTLGKYLKLSQRLSRLVSNLATMPYYVKWPSEDERKRPCISLIPLSAKTAMERLTVNKNPVILMSATIGNVKPLAAELDLEDLNMATLGHPVPVSARPIVDLRFNQRISWANQQSNPKLLEQQADWIYDWILTLDPSLRGVILAPSMAKISQLESTGLRRLRGRRLHAQHKGDSISKLVRQFIEFPHPGDVGIMTIQGAGTGVDLQGELARWIVVAGTDYANPRDVYIQARQQAGCGDYYWWRSYLNVVQAAGRVSRGERTETNGWLQNWAAIADPGLLTGLARKWYPPWFKEAIVPWQKE